MRHAVTSGMSIQLVVKSCAQRKPGFKYSQPKSKIVTLPISGASGNFKLEFLSKNNESLFPHIVHTHWRATLFTHSELMANSLSTENIGSVYGVKVSRARITVLLIMTVLPRVETQIGSISKKIRSDGTHQDFCWNFSYHEDVTQSSAYNPFD